MEDLRTHGFAPKAPVRYVKENAIEKRVPKEGDLLVAASGAGPCGRPLWFSPAIPGIYREPVIYSNFVKRFTTPGPEYAVYLDRILYGKFQDRTIEDFITGTSVPNLDAKGLLQSCRIVLPSSHILDIYYRQCLYVFSKLCAAENVVLAGLRDRLLSGLLSGAIPVPPHKGATA